MESATCWPTAATRFRSPFRSMRSPRPEGPSRVGGGAAGLLILEDGPTGCDSAAPRNMSSIRVRQIAKQHGAGANLERHHPVDGGFKAGGCAAKMSPRMLDSVLRRLPASSHPAVIVGYETSDDAGVYRLNDDLGAGADRGFFHADRRRSIYIWPNRGSQRLERYLCNGRPADLRAFDGWVSRGRLGGRPGANLSWGPLENGGGGVRGPGRPFDPRRRNKIWLRGNRRDRPQPGVAKRGSARVRRPVVHQTPGHRSDRYRAETRERPGVCGGSGDRIDDRG